MLEEVPVFWFASIRLFYDPKRRLITMAQILSRLFHEEQGQDIAEYAVMLAVILVIVVGTIRLIGTNANTVFSQVASSVQ